jgi:hypothetical protein
MQRVLTCTALSLAKQRELFLIRRSPQFAHDPAKALRRIKTVGCGFFRKIMLKQQAKAF